MLHIKARYEVCYLDLCQAPEGNKGYQLFINREYLPLRIQHIDNNQVVETLKG